MFVTMLALWDACVKARYVANASSRVRSHGTDLPGGTCDAVNNPWMAPGPCFEGWLRGPHKTCHVL